MQALTLTDEQILALAAAIKERRRQANLKLWTERFEAWCEAHPLPATNPTE